MTPGGLQWQLNKLGEMMGDGLHLEPDGKWIEREYRQVARALGLIPKQKRRQRVDPVETDRRMAERCHEEQCSKCDGQLQQTRRGSMRAKCQQCGARYQLLRTVKQPKQ